MPAAGSPTTALSYILLPGFALYTALNGSLLFGSGFGRAGDYIVIAIGSAAAWAALGFFITRLAGHRRHREP